MKIIKLKETRKQRKFIFSDNPKSQTANMQTSGLADRDVSYSHACKMFSVLIKTICSSFEVSSPITDVV